MSLKANQPFAGGRELSQGTQVLSSVMTEDGTSTYSRIACAGVGSPYERVQPSLWTDWSVYVTVSTLEIEHLAQRGRFTYLSACRSAYTCHGSHVGSRWHQTASPPKGSACGATFSMPGT